MSLVDLLLAPKSNGIVLTIKDNDPNPIWLLLHPAYPHIPREEFKFIELEPDSIGVIYFGIFYGDNSIRISSKYISIFIKIMLEYFTWEPEHNKKIENLQNS